MDIPTAICGGLCGGFFLSGIYCILDVQEWKMRQQQEILKELKKLNNGK